MNSIPVFYIVISLSLCVLLYFLGLWSKKENKNRRLAFDLALILMICGFIGGRLAHVFFEEWAYYQKNPILIFYFWQGGFVYYGGFIFATLCSFLYLKYKKINFLEWADFFTPLLSLSHAFGRIGCFLTGCCFGATCDAPWAIEGKHPTALYLFFAEILFMNFWFFRKRIIFAKAGSIFFTWVFWHASVRYVVEFYRADFRGEYINLPLAGHLSISQIISLFLIIVSIVMLSRRDNPEPS